MCQLDKEEAFIIYKVILIINKLNLSQNKE